MFFFLFFNHYFVNFKAQSVHWIFLPILLCAYIFIVCETSKLPFVNQRHNSLQPLKKNSKTCRLNHLQREHKIQYNILNEILMFSVSVFVVNLMLHVFLTIIYCSIVRLKVYNETENLNFSHLAANVFTVQC